MLKEPKVETTDDRIISFLNGNSQELNDNDRRIKIIYEYILEQFLEHRQDKEIRNRIIEQYHVSERMSYEYIHRARYVHGSFNKLNKNLAIYLQMQSLEKLQAQALIDDDYNLYFKCIAEKTKLIPLLPDEDPDQAKTSGARSYYMIINTNDVTFELDMKNIHKLKPEERLELFEKVKRVELNKNFDRLESELSSDE